MRCNSEMMLQTKENASGRKQNWKLHTNVKTHLTSILQKMIVNIGFGNNFKGCSNSIKNELFIQSVLGFLYQDLKDMMKSQGNLTQIIHSKIDILIMN